MPIEQVYLGRDNTIELALLADEEPVDMSGVDRVEIELGSVTLSSADKPEAVYWEQAEQRLKGRLQTVWTLFLKLGDEDLAAGRYSGRITVFDPDHPNGLVWGVLSIQVNP